MKQWIRSLDLSSLAPLALALLLGGAAAGVAAIASAQSSGISDERARAIALEHVPGEVLELEREDENGQPQIEIEVRGQDGRVHEIVLDAQSGEVVTIEEEEDDE